MSSPPPLAPFAAEGQPVPVDVEGPTRLVPTRPPSTAPLWAAALVAVAAIAGLVVLAWHGCAPGDRLAVLIVGVLVSLALVAPRRAG